MTSSPSPVTTPTASNPGLSVLKSSTTAHYSAVGDPVAYTFVVTNTGNVTLSAISVTDTQSAPATEANLSAITCPNPSLAPLATETCTATYTVTQADLDAGSVNDSATARGLPTGSVTPVTSSPSLLSVPAAATPALSMAKSVTSSGPYNTVGQSITYQFLATNTGNVTMTGVSVTDTQSAPAGSLSTGPSCASLATPSGPCSGASTTLAPGQVATFTGSYTITQADLDKGSVADSATVTGDPPGCASPLCAVTSSPSPVTTPTASNPGLSVLKSSTTPSYAAVGASIAYNFLVTNTGNVTVGTIAVSVPRAPRPPRPTSRRSPARPPRSPRWPLRPAPPPTASPRPTSTTAASPTRPPPVGSRRAA